MQFASDAGFRIYRCSPFCCFFLGEICNSMAFVLAPMFWVLVILQRLRVLH